MGKYTNELKGSVQRAAIKRGRAAGFQHVGGKISAAIRKAEVEHADLMRAGKNVTDEEKRHLQSLETTSATERTRRHDLEELEKSEWNP